MEFGILALIPPLVAIVLCFKTKRVLISLFIGILTGGIIISKGNPFGGIAYSLQTIINQINDDWNAKLLLFTFFMGSGISFIWKLAGSKALSVWAKKKIKSRKAVGIGAWLLGIVVCINDCLNSAIVGNVFRDITKEQRISSEKFSFILDATSAPVAALLISDWIAFQIGMIKVGIDAAGITGVGTVSSYFRSIPYNLYCILALIFVGIIVITGKDFGPMLKAENRAIKEGKIHRDGAQPMMDVGFELGEPKDIKPRILYFVLPLIAVIGISVFGLFWTGRAGNGIMEILENADAATALLWGAFSMALTGVVLAMGFRIMDLKETMDTFLDGFKLMVLTGCILVLAWSLGSITKEMQLGNYIVSKIGDSISFVILPIIIFILGMFVSFATGTSWGTMTIVTPLAVQLTYSVTGDAATSIAMAGVVFSGSIFGDHCSPISDTTVMASIFSGADHIDHVRTQIPYSLTVATVCIFLYLLYGLFKVNPFILIAIGAVLLVVIVYILSNYCSKKYKIDINSKPSSEKA